MLQPLKVVKEVSNEMCNCGDTLPVVRLSTNATVLACIEDTPKYIPGGIFSFHLSNGWPEARGSTNAYMGKSSY